jgi:hypothetical protein
MTLRLGKHFAIDGNFLRLGAWELVLVPRLYAAIGAEHLLAVHKMARSTYVYLGPRVLSIRRCR